MNDVEALVVSGRIEMEARQGVARQGKARQVRRPRRAPDHRRPRRCGRISLSCPGSRGRPRRPRSVRPAATWSVTDVSMRLTRLNPAAPPAHRGAPSPHSRRRRVHCRHRRRREGEKARRRRQDTPQGSLFPDRTHLIDAELLEVALDVGGRRGVRRAGYLARDEERGGVRFGRRNARGDRGLVLVVQGRVDANASHTNPQRRRISHVAVLAGACAEVQDRH